MVKKNIFLYATFFFIISRLFTYFVLEIKLPERDYSFHLMSKDLLLHDLLNSLFYYHFQPPLWNLFHGLVLKLFEGNQINISFFLNIYHVALTLFSIFYSILISRHFNLSNKHQYFLSFILIINPTIFFYENTTLYAHTIYFLNVALYYYILKFCRQLDFKNEIKVYIILAILSLLWPLFHPFLIILFFIFSIFFRKKLSNKILVPILFFIISISPMIKNKIIFNHFGYSSTGMVIGTVFLDWREDCGEAYQDRIFNTNKYFENNPEKKFNHKSLIGEESQYNNLGIWEYSKKCIKLTIDKLKQRPIEYLEDRTLSFIASHSKFGFDFMHPVPYGWKKYYEFINHYKLGNIKILKQIIVFAIILIIYLFLFYAYFYLIKEKYLKWSLMGYSFVYLNILIVSHLTACCEQERMMYSGFVINIIFFILLLKFTFKHDYKN